MTNFSTRSITRLLLPCMFVLLALAVAPLAAAGNGNGQGSTPSTAGNGQASSHQTSGTAATNGPVTSPQPKSTADQNGTGANQSGAYDSTRNGSPSLNGNGNGQATGKPCAGCVGKADNKNPQGQAPNGSDHNAGYECDGNNGIGKSNPAHTGCKSTPPCSSNCTQTPPCQSNCTPPCTSNCTSTPPCQTDCSPTPPCQVNCTPPPVCKSNCKPATKKCGQKGRPSCPKPHKAKVRCARGMKKSHGGCVNIGISAPRSCACHSALRIVVKAKAGTVVRVSGAGYSLVTRTGKNGQVVIKAKPTKKGILTVRAGGMVKRIGITCAPQGSQLTG